MINQESEGKTGMLLFRKKLEKLIKMGSQSLPPLGGSD